MSLLLVGYTLDLDERIVGFGITLAASVAQDAALTIGPIQHESGSTVSFDVYNRDAVQQWRV